MRAGFQVGASIRRGRDLVVEGRRQAQLALLRPVDKTRPAMVRRRTLGFQPAGHQRLGIERLRLERLGSEQFRLQDDPRRRLDRLHLVPDGQHGALGEGDQAGGPDPHPATRRRDPLDGSRQRPGPAVERALVVQQLPVAHVERFVVDEQAEELPVGHVDDPLTHIRKGVTLLGIAQRRRLEETVEVGAGRTHRFALLEGAPDPEVAVGQGEQGLGALELVEVEAHLA